MKKGPILEIGFKTYAQATGDAALRLAKICSELASVYGVNVIITVQQADIYRISKEVKIPVLAQHVDPILPGKHAGWLLPEAAKAAGAVGSMLNHSERPLQMSEIKKSIERLRELEMISLVCAESVEASKQIATFKPDMIMVELPELIGSGRAISKVKPEVILNTVKEVHKIDPRIKVLCGAGISGRRDARMALELGADGVGVSSYVVCAKDQRVAIREILESMISVI